MIGCYNVAMQVPELKARVYIDNILQIDYDAIMVRVGGGWEPLSNFLLEYDPCKAHKSHSGT